MKHFTLALAFALCAGMPSLNSAHAQGFELPSCFGYIEENDINTQAKLDSWMGLLDDNQPVFTVTIPGSHDTATYVWKSDVGGLTGAERWSTCQHLNIDEQLAIGVRAFDFRPGVDSEGIINKNYFIVCDHGLSRTGIKYKDAIAKLTSFLKAHPTEFFVIHIYKSDYSDDSHMQNLMNEVMNELNNGGFLANFKPDLTVGEMRGKILFLVRNQFNELCSLNYGGYMPTWVEEPDTSLPHTIVSYDGDATHTGKLLIQDKSNASATGMIDVKKGYIQTVLGYMGNLNWTSDPVWCLNLISGYSKTDNVAGKDISRTDGYMDNAQHMNTYVYEYLKGLRDARGERALGNYKPAGIVFADYVGLNSVTFKLDAFQSKNTYTTNGANLVHELILNNVRVKYKYALHHDYAGDTRYDLEPQTDGVTHKLEFQGNLDYHFHFVKVPDYTTPAAAPAADTPAKVGAAAPQPAEKHLYADYAPTTNGHYTVTTGPAYNWKEGTEGTLFTSYDGSTTSGRLVNPVILLKDGEGEHTVTFTGGSVTAIENVAAEADPAEARYFNLQGIEVAPSDLTPGTYVKVCGTTATKVAIR